MPPSRCGPPAPAWQRLSRERLRLAGTLATPRRAKCSPPPPPSSPALSSSNFQDFDLLKEEVLQLLNHAPADPLGVFVCLTNDGEDRISEDDYDRIAAVVQKHLAS